MRNKLLQFCSKLHKYYKIVAAKGNKYTSRKCFFSGITDKVQNFKIYVRQILQIQTLSRNNRTKSEYPTLKRNFTL